MSDFFKINGHWKNDNEPIINGLVSVDAYDCLAEDLTDTTKTNGVKDEDIFYYGLDESEIKRIIEEGAENDQVDFIITSYSKA